MAIGLGVGAAILVLIIIGIVFYCRYTKKKVDVDPGMQGGKGAGASS